MQLLQDIFIIENLQILSEGAGSDKFKLRGVFGRCNEKNNNGRIYPTAVLEGQLKKIQPLINERRLCGELDHPQNDTVKLSNASHLITKLELKGNELIGEAELLKTPAGLTAKALVEGGVKIGISSRGMGTLSEDSQGNKIVNEDFRLVTFDLVADPSTRGAYPTLAESTESRFVRESTDKLQKEVNFLTLLESKIKDAYNPFLEEAKKKKEKKQKNNLDPVGEEDKDINNDGVVDSTDSYLVNRRKAIGSAMKKENIEYFNIGLILAEALGDFGETSKLAGKNTDDEKDTGSILGNIRARQHAKKLQIAKAKGARKASKIMAKGDVEADRIRARGAAGGTVSRNPFGAGGQRYAQKTRGLEQRKERAERSKQRLADRLSGEGSSTEPETPKVETPKVETPKVETPKVETPIRSGRRRRSRRRRSRKLNRPNTNSNSNPNTNPERFQGALGGLGSNPPPGSKPREDNHTVYKQIGLHLAEAFDLIWSHTFSKKKYIFYL